MITKQQFEEICDDLCAVGLEPFSYSGRGMCGERCLAVVATMGDLEGVSKHLRLADASQDSMGLNRVFYWRKVKWQGEED